jgi:hypothetical protein
MDETGPAGVFGFVTLIGLGVLCVWAVRWATRRADGGEVDDWSQAHGLALTPGNRPAVLRYLSRVKRFRRIGALAGLATPAGIAALTSAYLSVALGVWVDGYGELWRFGPFWVLAGYVLGILGAELSLSRRAGDGGRAASLVPRELPSYLPRGMVLALRALALAGAALVPVYLAAPRGAVDTPTPGGPLFAVTAL